MQAVNFFPTAKLNMFSGYGKLETGLLGGLLEAGVQVHGSGMGMSPAELRKYPRQYQDALTRMMREEMEADVVIVTALPKNCDGWHSLLGKRVWLYTMSESTQVSKKWVRQINRWCEGVFVPCAPLVEVYRASGVSVPIVDVGMGVDYCVPTVAADPVPADDKFIFMSYSYGDMRKGAHKAILAFKKLYGDNPRFELWIKARGAENTWLAACEDEQIKIINKKLSERGWFDLLSQVDAFVFPSYGEGFGLPPREATLAHVPTLATRWLGLWDVECWGLPIETGRHLPAQFTYAEANSRKAEWVEPDEQSLEQQMQWVVDNYAEAMAQAKVGRDYLLVNFTWKRTAQRMMEAIYGTHHTTVT